MLNTKIKYIILIFIKIYQLLLSPFQVLFPTAGCRFWPSCSEYTYKSIEKYGAAKGVKLGVLRILKCNPWS